MRWGGRVLVAFVATSFSAIGSCTLFVDTGDLNSSSGNVGAKNPDAGSGTLADGSDEAHSETGVPVDRNDGGIDGSASSSYAAMILATPGLIAYWRLGDPANSTSAASAIVGGRVGKIGAGVKAAAPSVIKNDTDTSFSFADSSETEVVDFGTDIFSFPGKSPFSIELWHSPASVQDFQALISKHNLKNPNAIGWVLSVEAPYGYAIYKEDGTSGDSVESAFVPKVGETHHVVATFDGTLLHLFVDATEPKGSTLCDRSLPETTLPLRVGTTTFGRLDEIALYDRALTIAEVTTHYAKGK